MSVNDEISQKTGKDDLKEKQKSETGTWFLAYHGEKVELPVILRVK